MQGSTIAEYPCDVTPNVDDPDILRLMQVDRRIRSVTVVREGQLTRIKQSQKQENGEQVESAILDSETPETLLVSDLFEEIQYLVAPSRSLYQLVFTLKDRQVIVATQPGADLTEIAHGIVKQLASSAALKNSGSR